jgi:hypothetical protein
MAFAGDVPIACIGWGIGCLGSAIQRRVYVCPWVIVIIGGLGIVVFGGERLLPGIAPLLRLHGISTRQ